MSEWREDKDYRATYRHTPTPTAKVLKPHSRLSNRGICTARSAARDPYKIVQLSAIDILIDALSIRKM